MIPFLFAEIKISAISPLSVMEITVAGFSANSHGRSSLSVT